MIPQLHQHKIPPLIPVSLGTRVLLDTSLPDRAYQQGQKVLEHRWPLVVLLSPGNPQFSQEYVSQLLESAYRSTDTLRIFNASPLYPYNHAALGWDEADSTAWIAKKDHQLMKRCEGFSRARGGIADFEKEWLMHWEKHIMSHEAFLRWKYALTALLERERGLASQVREASQQFLEHKELRGTLSMEERIKYVSQFLIDENALLLASPEILNAPGVGVLYHRHMPILVDLVSGKYASFPQSELGMILAVENRS